MAGIKDKLKAQGAAEQQRTVGQAAANMFGLRAFDSEVARPIRMDEITVDWSLQIRDPKLNEETVDDYFERLANGSELDAKSAIILYQVDEEGVYLLAGGFHRYEAHRRAGREEILSYVRRGSRKDAITFAAGHNLSNGLPLTNADKRRAYFAYLDCGHEMASWSFGRVAAELGVADRTVSRWYDSWRGEATPTNVGVPAVRIGRDNRVIDTSNIGTREAAIAAKEDMQRMLQPLPAPTPANVRRWADEAEAAKAAEADPPPATRPAPQSQPVQLRLFEDDVQESFSKATTYLVNLPAELDLRTKQQAMQQIEYLETLLADLKNFIQK